MTQFDVSEPGGQFLLTVRPDARRPVMVADFLMAGITFIVALVGMVACLKFLPSPWIAISLLMLVLLVICWQSVVGFMKERRAIEQGDVYRLDRVGDRISHNGTTIGVLSQIEQVLVRNRTAHRGRVVDLALRMRDSSEIILPTKEKPEMERLALQIATYLGTRVSYDVTDDF